MKRAGPTYVVILQLTNTVTVQQSRKRAMQAGSAGALIEPQEALLMLNNLPSSHIARVTLDGQWNYCQFGKY